MTKFKIFTEKIFILWELHSKILVGDKNLFKRKGYVIMQASEAL